MIIKNLNNNKEEISNISIVYTWMVNIMNVNHSWCSVFLQSYCFLKRERVLGSGPWIKTSIKHFKILLLGTICFPTGCLLSWEHQVLFHNVHNLICNTCTDFNVTLQMTAKHNDSIPMKIWFFWCFPVEQTEVWLFLVFHLNYQRSLQNIHEQKIFFNTVLAHYI